MRKLILVLFLCNCAFGQMKQKPLMGRKVNWSHPLSKGLVGCWLMNEGGGNAIFDLSGNGHTGIFYSDISWEVGRFGTCIRSEGTISDEIDIGINSYDLGIRNEASFCAWVKLDDITPAADQGIVSDWDSSVGFNLMIDNSPQGGVTMYVYPDNTRASSAAGIIHEGWNFVAGTLDGTDLKIYHDGIYQAFDAINSDMGDSASTIKIGVRGDSSGPTKGLIDYLTIHNRALSASEITRLYMDPFCMFRKNKMALWYAAIPAVTAEGQVIIIMMD